MKLLSILLIIISLSKLATALSLERPDFQKMVRIEVPIIGDPYKIILSALVFDGLLGLLCGLFLTFAL